MDRVVSIYQCDGQIRLHKFTPESVMTSNLLRIVLKFLDAELSIFISSRFNRSMDHTIRCRFLTDYIRYLN
jgi:hypothetical protein